MNTKTAITIVILSALSFSLVAGVQLVHAQSFLAITIKPDGSIEPSTSLLERNGTTYTFQGDIFGSIMVQTGYITIDGAGHTLQGNGTDTGQNSEIGILLSGPDLSHRECAHVLVQNLRIYNIPRGVFSVGGSNNSFVNNYFENSGMEIQGNANQTGDLIKHNTIINATIAFEYDPNGTDTITENNFLNCQISIWLSKLPTVDRNYWNDYTTKYPNAAEIDNTGVGDTPYVYATGENQTGTAYYQDNHPLTKTVSTSWSSFPLAGSWTTLASMPTPRYGLGLAVVDGKIYAIGGQIGDPLLGTCLNTNEMYDPTTNTWTTKAPMPTPRSFFGIAVYQNKIYAIGGDTGLSNVTPGRDVTGANEVYDPASNTWATKAEMPTPRGYLDANVVNGKIYLIGGGFLADDFNGIGSEVGNEVYDPASNSWTAKASIPVGPSNLGIAAYASAVAGEKIYLIGGITSTRGWDNFNFAYDTVTDSWSSAAPMPLNTSVAYMTANTVTTADGRQQIYVLGGENAININSTMIYDVASGVWVSGTPLLTPRWALSSAILNDDLYVIGGIANTTLSYGAGYFFYTAYTVTATNEMYAFQPGEINSATPPSSPTPTSTPILSPTISILSPQNNTFFNVSIEGVSYQLIYETNTTLSWVGYSINGIGNSTVSENATWVHDFGSSGYHTLTLYANDTSGNWAIPQTVTYLVNLYPDYAPTPSPSPTEQPTLTPTPPPVLKPFPFPEVVTVILLVAAIVIGAYYFGRHKKRNA